MAKKYIVTVNGTSYEVLVEDADPNAAYTAAPVEAPKQVEAPKAAPAPAAAPAVPADGLKITAPLPGNILKVEVSAGANVKKGDVLCVLEAMKMENEIQAPRDGVIKSVTATKGASVNTGDVLFVIG